MLEAVKALGLVHEGAVPTRSVSVSVGIAFHDDASRCRGTSHGHCTASNLVLTANWALYAAKRAGRAQAKLFDIEDVCMPDSALATARSP